MKKLCTEQVTMTSADEANTLDESRNPMPDTVVLTCLFDSCDLSDLPLFRQVSSLWDSISVARFRNEMTVVIRTPPFVSLKGDHLDNPNKGLEWETVNNELLELKGKPFRSFRIMHMEFGSPSSQLNCGGGGSRNFRMMRKNMSQFWEEFGSWIRKLELRHIQVYSVEAFKRAIFEETPNVEELRLGKIDNKSGHVPDNNGGMHEEILKLQPNLKQLVVVMSPSGLPITWNLLLRSYPNVHCLEVIATVKGGAEITEVQRHFAHISQLLQTKKQCKLIARRLRMVAWTPEEIRTAIGVLQTPKLTLNDLILYTSGSDGVRADLVRLLLSTTFRLHGSTLETLIVFVLNANESHRLDNFPCYPGPFSTVNSLILSGNVYKNLNFLEHFPNLKLLCLRQAGEDIFANTDSGRMAKLKLHKLNHAVLTMERDLYITREGMELLVKLMPNVNIFGGKLSNMSLMILCRELRKLKLLVIREIVYRHDQNTTLDDEGMTGIVAGSDLRMPNITDLHDLESLVIKQRIKVGDDSVWNGFLEVPRLKILEVELAHETSDAAFEALTKKFPGGGITRRQAED